MASLRQKESKIPLRVDLKMKNISKIPLRVETKPKVLTSSEAELKGTSALCKKKDFINPGRSKKPPKEITNKELKPANLHLRNKTKENRSQPPCKISQNKGNNNRAPKSIATDKRVTISKPVSQVLKDRNKITKDVPEKNKSVNVKSKDGPFCSFKKKIPKINISEEDPFKTHAEKKPIINSNHPSQQDIEFVADDRMRDLILSNKELTPGILKSCSNMKTPFAMERPSLYNRPRICVDPYKQALADIANSNLASEGRRITEMQKNRLNGSPFQRERPSLYNRPRICVDPYKQALADIANSNLASEGRRISEMQKNRLCASPLQNRNSLYQKSTFVGDPYKKALKDLEELRLHRKVKSCKKVTFKLSGEDRSLEAEYRYENDGKKSSIKEIQPKLTDPSAKYTESCTRPPPEFEENNLTAGSNYSKVTIDSPSKPNKESSIRLTPEFEKKSLLTSISKPSNTFTINSSSKLNEAFVNSQINIASLPDNTEKQEKYIFIDNANPSTSPYLKTVTNNEKSVCDFSPILFQSQKSNKYANICSHEIKNSILKTVNLFLPGTSEVRHSLFSKQSECVLDKMNPKIFTPQPVSLYPRTKLPQSISPEFLSHRTTDILSLAPINTPSVLKSLSKQEQSPVCKKLEFIDSPKETNKDPGELREWNQTFDFQNIMTQQKILDQLAHQECSIFMHEATFPCEIRRHLQNPIAQILNDGDEMHFVPVSLWRLS